MRIPEPSQVHFASEIADLCGRHWWRRTPRSLLSTMSVFMIPTVPFWNFQFWNHWFQIKEENCPTFVICDEEDILRRCGMKSQPSWKRFCVYSHAIGVIRTVLLQEPISTVIFQARLSDPRVAISKQTWQAHYSLYSAALRVILKLWKKETCLFWRFFLFFWTFFGILFRSLRGSV